MSKYGWICERREIGWLGAGRDRWPVGRNAIVARSRKARQRSSAASGAQRWGL